uniref:Uncharacterized protein n=1 Tax=Arundo donax TaxID=35708 RepID=A0A0A9BW07_ARUDO
MNYSILLTPLASCQGATDTTYKLMCLLSF